MSKKVLYACRIKFTRVSVGNPIGVYDTGAYTMTYSVSVLQIRV